MKSTTSIASDDKPKEISKFDAVLPVFGGMSFYTVRGLAKEVKFCNYDSLDQIDFRDDLWPVAVAAFDTARKHVYVASLYPDTNHGDLVAAYDLPNTSEDDLLNGEVLYGFVTASGHFLNRTEAAKWVEKKFSNLLNKPIDKDTGRLISSNINWRLVIQKVNSHTGPLTTEYRYSDAAASVLQPTTPPQGEIRP